MYENSYSSYTLWRQPQDGKINTLNTAILFIIGIIGDRDSSAGLATRYGLGSPWFEPRCGRVFLCPSVMDQLKNSGRSKSDVKKLPHWESKILEWTVNPTVTWLLCSVRVIWYTFVTRHFYTPKPNHNHYFTQQPAKLYRHTGPFNKR